MFTQTQNVDNEANITLPLKSRVLREEKKIYLVVVSFAGGKKIHTFPVAMLPIDTLDTEEWVCTIHSVAVNTQQRKVALVGGGHKDDNMNCAQPTREHTLYYSWLEYVTNSSGNLNLGFLSTNPKRLTELNKMISFFY